MAYTFERQINERKDAAPVIQPEAESSNRLPNSLVSRIMEDPKAENEADRLSRGITASTPIEVMREMGGRLGADFSGVQFHSDSLSTERSRAMGAKGWARGRDIYFGKGGFDPKVAAHELVHTVQQGAVKGDASVSMPYGAVQLDRDDDNTIRTDSNQQGRQQNDRQKNRDESLIRKIESRLFRFFATREGVDAYMEFEGKIKDLLNSRLNKKEYKFSPRGSVSLMIRAAYRDYALREILLEIVNSPVATKEDRKERVGEYKALIKTLSSRLTGADAEELAIETGMFTGVPKYSHTGSRGTKRAYEQQADENGQISFNPNNVKALGKVQDAIDQAATPEQAYSIFAAYTGNPGGEFIDRYKNIKLDMTLFRNKLKNMARVVTDYPELKNMIGDMDTCDPKSDRLMDTIATRGGVRQATFTYNKRQDKEGIFEDLERGIKDEREKADPFHIASRDYYGAHEMGHVMASLLIEGGGKREALFRNTTSSERVSAKMEGRDLGDFRPVEDRPMMAKVNDELYELAENDMLESVLAKNNGAIAKKYDLKSLVYAHDRPDAIKGMLSLKGSGYNKNGATSKYGSYGAGEMFAEAVADIYAHGNQAREMSIEFVKEYEKRQKEKVRTQFSENKKNATKKSWWRRLFGF